MSDAERIDALARNFDKLRAQLAAVTTRVNEQTLTIERLTGLVATQSAKRHSNPFGDIFGGTR